MSKSLLAELTERLLSGEEGSHVVQAMRDHPTAFKTDCSVQSYVSRIRRGILDSSDPRARHPEYEESVNAFLRSSEGADPRCRALALEFEGFDARGRFQMLRQHRLRKFCMGDPEVDAALSRVRLLPDNMRSFRTPPVAAESCRRQGELSTVHKNESVLVVKEGSSVLARATRILEECSIRTSYVDLGFALLLVSGRRMAEIFNGSSRFTPGPPRLTDYCSIFRGQLKRHRPAPPYLIALLCPYATFMRGLDALREKQSRAGREAGGEDNGAVHVRYSSNIHKRMDELLAPGATVHDLRKFYIQAVWQGFGFEETSLTFNRVAMHFLGHLTLGESLHYNSVRVRGFHDRFPGLRPPVLGTPPT